MQNGLWDIIYKSHWSLFLFIFVEVIVYQNVQQTNDRTFWKYWQYFIWWVCIQRNVYANFSPYYCFTVIVIVEIRNYVCDGCMQNLYVMCSVHLKRRKIFTFFAVAVYWIVYCFFIDRFWNPAISWWFVWAKYCGTGINWWLIWWLKHIWICSCRQQHWLQWDVCCCFNPFTGNPGYTGAQLTLIRRPAQGYSGAIFPQPKDTWALLSKPLISCQSWESHSQA